MSKSIKALREDTKDGVKTLKDAALLVEQLEREARHHKLMLFRFISTHGKTCSHIQNSPALEKQLENVVVTYRHEVGENATGQADIVDRQTSNSVIPKKSD